MRKLFALLAICFAASGLSIAQDVEWYNITALNAVVTGNTDNEHALKQYLLFSDNTAENHRDLFEQFKTFTEENNQMHINAEIPESKKMYQDMLTKIEQTMQEHPELAASMKEQLEEAKKQVANIDEYTDPSVKEYTHDPATLLKNLKAIAVNQKSYSGYHDMGNGLYAVTESPRYGLVYEQAFEKIEMDDKYKYTWGVINQQGKVVIPQKYGLLTGYYSRPEHDFLMLTEMGKDGKEHCGAFSYDGRIRIPFIFDDVDIIDTSEKVVVGSKNGKYGSTDFDGKTLWPFEYVAMDKSGIGWPVSKDGNNWGVISYQGKEMIPFKYKSFWSNADHTLKMERFDGKLDVFDDNFKFIRTENAE
ncbi:MAG: WG repeat-containing protein [Bacteroidales bacterium]|nr:WG repeat-containing protein [Bacteroidales bacterium]